MATTLFTSAAGVFRGNLHGHSTHSDGQNSPADVVRLHREAGYDFTCLSEHLWTDPRFSAPTIIDATAFDSADFITIISAELHCPGKAHDRDGLWHIVANGLPADFPVADSSETGPELVARAVAAGAYVTIAHPEWYSLTDDEARSLAAAGAHGVEIYNHSS
ncbi:MAG: PHP domain-containing protein, partial [Candidatus Puniceispirillaceae bacterium]